MQMHDKGYQYAVGGDFSYWSDFYVIRLVIIVLQDELQGLLHNGLPCF